jgi:hypothetical protein
LHLLQHAALQATLCIIEGIMFKILEGDHGLQHVFQFSNVVAQVHPCPKDVDLHL